MPAASRYLVILGSMATLMDWSPIISKGLTGLLGAAVGVLGTQVGTFLKERRRARGLVLKHLDPILKAADALGGDIHALALRDFVPEVTAGSELSPMIYDATRIYLFARFWAEVQVLRAAALREGMAIDRIGGQVLPFLRCLEDRRIRLVGREWQRLIGESLIAEKGGRLNLYEFVTKYEAEGDFRRWFEPLATVFHAAKTDRKSRQTILRFGYILRVFVAVIDKTRVITVERRSFSHKLSRRSKQELLYKAIRQYVSFAEAPEIIEDLRWTSTTASDDKKGLPPVSTLAS